MSPRRPGPPTETHITCLDPSPAGSIENGHKTELKNENCHFLSQYLWVSLRSYKEYNQQVVSGCRECDGQKNTQV